jgi:thiamine-monophosphate kinase
MSDGEFDRISRLARRFAGPAPPALGIGDDAALLPIIDGPLAITTDASVEGVHFRRAWAPLDRIAKRAVEAAVSDLAAMGADPSLRGGGLLFGLELPGEFSAHEFDALIEGLARGAESHRAPVLGGNLARSTAGLSITTTALGVARRPLRRVFVTGAVGAARLGVEALLAERSTEPLLAPFCERWLSVRAQVAEGLALASLASAAIDLSDGLAADAAHLCARSSVSIVLDAEALPFAPRHHEACAALSLDWLDVALRGGEEYALLFTMPIDQQCPIDATRVGVVRDGAGVFVRVRGVERPLRGGWDHFARQHRY